MNITSNVIAIFNQYLIFGTDDGKVQVFDIHSNVIALNKKVAAEGIIVLMLDNENQSIFYGAGYSGEIVKC